MKGHQDPLPTQPDTVLTDPVAHELQMVPFGTNMMCYKTLVLKTFLMPITPGAHSQVPAYLKHKPDFVLNNETLDIGSGKECLWLNFHAESFFFTGAMTTNPFKTTAEGRR